MIAGVRQPSVKKMANRIKIETRNAIIKELSYLHGKEDFQINGALTLINFLNQIWELSKSQCDRIFYKMEYGGEEWSYEDLFLFLNLPEESDDTFCKFVGKIVSPELLRDESERQSLIEIINKHLSKDSMQLLSTEKRLGNVAIYEVSDMAVVAQSKIKNLIFAAQYKPDSPLIEDALSNKIKFDKQPENYLVLEEDDELSSEYLDQNGLSWNSLVCWWKRYTGKINLPGEQSAEELYNRLRQSISPDSPPEKIFWETYFKEFCCNVNSRFPALIPQVYFHYDPKTSKELYGEKRLVRQRMDFLLLLPYKARIVIEIDGIQHYSENLFKITEGVLTNLKNEKTPSVVIRIVKSWLTNSVYHEEDFERYLLNIEVEKYRKRVKKYASYKKNSACPKKYAEMVEADRQLRLNGYEVYRFGGYELQEGKEAVVTDFFNNLFRHHQLAATV